MILLGIDNKTQEYALLKWDGSVKELTEIYPDILWHSTFKDMNEVNNFLEWYETGEAKKEEWTEYISGKKQ